MACVVKTGIVLHGQTLLCKMLIDWKLLGIGQRNMGTEIRIFRVNLDGLRQGYLWHVHSCKCGKYIDDALQLLFCDCV